MIKGEFLELSPSDLTKGSEDIPLKDLEIKNFKITQHEFAMAELIICYKDEGEEHSKVRRAKVLKSTCYSSIIDGI